MKRCFFRLLLPVFLLCSCGDGDMSSDDKSLSMPSWISSTVSFFEDERISIGDSIRMSQHYFLRLHLEDEARRCFADKSRHVSLAGTPANVMRMMTLHGALTYDSYHSRHGDVNCGVLARKVEQAARSAVSLDEAKKRAGDIIDNDVEFLPNMVFLLGAEYTPLEFAHSVALADDYQWLTVTDEASADSIKTILDAAIDEGGRGVWYGKIPRHSIIKEFLRAEGDEASLEIIARSTDGKKYSVADNPLKINEIDEKTIKKNMLGVFLKK